jgi:hypothetical protein
MHDRTITITICDNGYHLDGQEGSVVFSDGPDEVLMNDYSPSLKLLVNHLLHCELMEDNGNKFGKQLCVEEYPNE